MNMSVIDSKWIESRHYSLRLPSFHNGKVLVKAIPYGMNVTLRFRDRRGTASLRHRNRAATTIFVCEQKHDPVWFSWRRKSYPCSIM